MQDFFRYFSSKSRRILLWDNSTFLANYVAKFGYSSNGIAYYVMVQSIAEYYDIVSLAYALTAFSPIKSVNTAK